MYIQFKIYIDIMIYELRTQTMYTIPTPLNTNGCNFTVKIRDVKIKHKECQIIF